MDDSSLVLGGGHHHDTFVREYSRPGVVIRRRVAESDRDETLVLAIVFGVASVPWTYVFVAVLEIPLWPSFVASASFYPVAANGLTRLKLLLVRVAFHLRDCFGVSLFFGSLG